MTVDSSADPATGPAMEAPAPATPTPPPATAGRGARGQVAGWIGQRGVYVALVLLVIFNIAFTPYFATLATLQLLAVQTSVVILVSLGMALVIGTGGVDLSVGALMAISAAMTAHAFTDDGLGLPIGVSMLLGVVLSTAIGAFNGLVITVARVQPIVATLAVLVGGRGLALMITHGALVELFPPFFTTIRSAKLVGIPDVFWLAALAAAACSVLMHRTTFGYRILAIGGNLRASGLAGLPVGRTIVTVYAISGLLSGVAGVVATARIRAADPSYVGLGIELTAITAVVIGGTLLTGGRVRILGTVVGAVLIQLLENTLVAHGVRDSVARIVEALVIIAAIFLQRSWKAGR